MSTMSQPVILAVPLDKENVDPQTDPSTSDLSQTSAPTEPKRAATISIIPAPPAAADDEQATTASSSSDGSSQKKKRKQPATAPRTLSKEELADYIARDEFWQKCEAAEGDGDGYEFARGEGDEEDEPVYDDCNEVRRKITAFLKTGRMTQTALLKLLNVNGGSFQRFMKQKGPLGGTGNGVYAAAARFFESLRILEHKPKTAKRRREEAAFGKHGRATHRLPQSFLTLPGDKIVSDDVGRTRIIPAGETTWRNPKPHD